MAKVLNCKHCSLRDVCKADAKAREDCTVNDYSSLNGEVCEEVDVRKDWLEQLTQEEEGELAAAILSRPCMGCSGIFSCIVNKERERECAESSWSLFEREDKEVYED